MIALLLAAALVVDTAQGAAPVATATPTPVPAAVLTVDGADAAAIDAATARGPDVRWTTVVIHHSGAADGSAATLAEQARGVPGGALHHFVIDDGSDGTADGAIEVTPAWISGRRTPHLLRMDLQPAISICLVGDFDRAEPSAAQRRSLAELLRALTKRFAIPVDRVLDHREADGRAVRCPGTRFPKLSVLQDAGLLPGDPPQVRVTKSAGEVAVVRGDHLLERFTALPAPSDKVAALPVGTWPVCRKDPMGAFGATIVIGYPGAAEIESARASRKISDADAKRLSAALAAGKCPPDDTALGGEIGIHGGGKAAVDVEPSPCVVLDDADAHSLWEAVPEGAPVEIVP